MAAANTLSESTGLEFTLLVLTQIAPDMGLDLLAIVELGFHLHRND
jgi:hypothetical protein